MPHNALALCLCPWYCRVSTVAELRAMEVRSVPVKGPQRSRRTSLSFVCHHRTFDRSVDKHVNNKLTPDEMAISNSKGKIRISLSLQEFGSLFW